VTLQQHEDTVARLFVYCLFLFFAGYLLSLSIQYTDSDLWYHLTGGRHFIETGTLYNPFINSYLTEPRDFINYYWGFQTLSYFTWSLAAEPGLIILKTVMFVLSGVFATKIILDGQPIRSARFLPLFIMGLIIGILCSRGLSLRPHLASYVFIPLFIYILGYREKLYPLLPLLTIVWVNLHGVEYVVGALICGSYFLQRLSNHYTEPGSLKPLGWILLCLPAMMLNPNGVLILLTPFAHDPDLGQFILELGRFEPRASLDLQEGVTQNTLVLLLLFFVVISVFNCLSDLRRHLAPILIAAGGLILLIMAKRFVWEWALLSTPIIAAGLRQWRGPTLGIPATTTLVIVLMVLPVTFWPLIRNGLQHYPVDQESLPYGTTEFIRQTKLTGRYAIEPSYAGYIEFALAPEIKIHMDMQFPPFTSMDIHEINAAMNSAAGLRTYVEKYDPDLIGVKKSLTHFPTRAAYSLGYLPVFFDKRVVLFVNTRNHPDTASRHQLRAINPFNETVIPAELMEQGIRELEQMLTIVDTNDIKLTLTGLLIEHRRLSKAQVYLSDLQKSAPADVSTIYFSARMHHLNENFADAVTDYEKAISYSGGNDVMHQYAAECYFLLGDQRNAYRHFKRAFNPYKDRNPDPLIYFQFALSAVGVGEDNEARRLLRMIERFAPKSDLQPQISKMLEDLNHDN
jgi:tetratricopeptide (TPR) repeat protein